MTEVADPPFWFLATLECFAHALDLPLDRVLPTVQHIWIEVSLKRDFIADLLARLGGVNAPVETQNVVTGLVGQERKGPVCAFREQHERRNRNIVGRQFGSNVRGDVLQSRKRKLYEIVRSEFIRIGVEDLQELMEAWRSATTACRHDFQLT
jgi:hypothetical protein